MKPIKFPEATKDLAKPVGWDDNELGECVSLPVWNDGIQCVSKWRLSLWERLKVLWYGHVWLYVVSGHTQPPVALEAGGNPFSFEDNARGEEK